MSDYALMISRREKRWQINESATADTHETVTKCSTIKMHSRREMQSLLH